MTTSLLEDFVGLALAGVLTVAAVMLLESSAIVLIILSLTGAALVVAGLSEPLG